MQASHFDYEYVLGHKIAFLCVAKGNPRPHITWLKDGVEIFSHLYMHVSIATQQQQRFIFARLLIVGIIFKGARMAHRRRSSQVKD